MPCSPRLPPRGYCHTDPMRKPVLFALIPVVAACLVLGLSGSPASAKTKAPPPVFHKVGSDSETTKAFTITGSSWRVAWQYQCIGNSGFGFQVKGVGKARHTRDKGASASGFTASGTTRYKDTGRFELAISVGAHCEWSVVVNQKS
jgi:hypothetical protein